MPMPDNDNRKPPGPWRKFGYICGGILALSSALRLFGVDCNYKPFCQTAPQSQYQEAPIQTEEGPFQKPQTIQVSSTGGYGGDVYLGVPDVAGTGNTGGTDNTTGNLEEKNGIPSIGDA